MPFNLLRGAAGPTFGAPNTVSGSAPVITSPSSLVAGTINVLYPTTTFTATGTAPITWSITAGTLPAGMTFSSGGVLAGTPTVTASGSITFTATNAFGSANRSLTLTINAAGTTAPFISPRGGLPNGKVNEAYTSTTFAATGTSPINWSNTAGAVPAGMALSSGGVLSGTPTAVINNPITIQADNAVGFDYEYLGLVVYKPDRLVNDPVIEDPVFLSSGTVNVAFVPKTFVATGTAPITWSISSGTLPSGMSFSSAGVLSGTPTATFNGSITFRATNSVASATISCVLVVLPVTITTTYLNTGTVNSTFPTTTLTAIGAAPITWSIASGALPSGMSLSSAGVLSGTPTEPTNRAITFAATNSSGQTNKSLWLTVLPVSGYATPSNILPPTIETVISGATINQVGTMLRVKRGGWPATQSWTLDWLDKDTRYANPGISITNGFVENTVKFALSRRYQWLRNGAAIPRQNGITYTLTSADVGQTIAVRETVNRIVPNVSNTSFTESATTVSVTSTQTVTGISGTQTANLVYENNLTYLGSFRPHNAYFDTPSIVNVDYARAIAFDAAGNGGAGSLYFLCGINNVTSECAIPASFADGFVTSYDSLPEASLLQTPRVVFDWQTQAIPEQPTEANVYGQLIYNGRLIQSSGAIYSYAVPSKTHGARSKVLSTVQASQTSLVTPSGGYGNGRWLSGPMCLIPSSWQPALGGKALTGWAGISINSNSNKGPPAFAFDPDLVGTGPVTAQTLLYYSNAQPLDAESQNEIGDAKGSQAPLWTPVSFGYGAFGMSIPNGTDSLLYIGPHPVGLQGYSDTVGNEVDNVDLYYGGGTRNAFDPKQGTRGPYAGTYVMNCWAYNLNDLASVKLGSVFPYNVKPYSVWAISLPYMSASNTNSDLSRLSISGSAYDPASKRLFIAHGAPGSSQPLVFSVFSVSNAV
jgi:hypothetical protein